MNRHKLTHKTTDEHLFKCEVEDCQANFLTKDHLERHMKTHETSIYKCSFEGCNRVFKKHRHRYNHECKHRGELPYKCTVEGCDKEFLYQSQLNNHQFSHLERNRYLCGEHNCGQSFNKWTEFNAHTKQCHPMKCPVCDKTFTKTSNYKEHIKTHDSERPKLKCSYENCSKEFSTVQNLNFHVRTYHRSTEQFSCPYCFKLCTTKGNMFLHIKSVHNTDSEDQPKKRAKKSTVDSLIQTLSGKLDKSYKYQCPAIGCVKLFKRYTSMASHMKRIHNMENDGPVSPPISNCPTPSLAEELLTLTEPEHSTN